MLFARTYTTATDDYPSIRAQIKEDMRRGYSWWAGQHAHGLAREPDYLTFEEYAATLPETAEKLAQHDNGNSAQQFIPGEWRLPGLCAVCGASSYPELAQRIWEDHDNETSWIRGQKVVVAIFEGDLVGCDPEGWPLFKPRKVSAIAELDGIARAKKGRNYLATGTLQT